MRLDWLLSSRAWGIAGATAGIFAGLAGLTSHQGRKAEEEFPPMGRFLMVNGVRLHYVDVGRGAPIVLLHGAGSMIPDFALSILDPLAAGHRVIAFDRPGYGYSTRPEGIDWTPAAQAALLRDALTSLGVERPVIVGHSWGCCVALAWAMDYPDEVAGLVLENGYYFPTGRAELWLAALLGAPAVGPLLNRTVTPLVGRALVDPILDLLFSPNPVPPDFARRFPVPLCLRPSQLRANAEEIAMIDGWSGQVEDRYAAVRVPTRIVAGLGDKVVEAAAHSIRLSETLPHSKPHMAEDCGHVVHHARRDWFIDIVAAARSSQTS